MATIAKDDYTRDLESDLSESSSSCSTSSDHPGHPSKDDEGCLAMSCCTLRCRSALVLIFVGFCLCLIVYCCSLVQNLPSGGYDHVHCRYVNIDGLRSPFRGALACFPQATEENITTFPLNVFAHGDFLVPALYKPLLRQIASFGFTVVAYDSCAFSWGALPQISQCNGGQSSFLEILATINYLLYVNPEGLPIDASLLVTVTGHSTGARAALMVAAVKDNPAYLRNTMYYAALEDESRGLRRAARRVGAVVSSHPDAMFDSTFNPDVEGYIVNSTPAFILTSVYDLWIEPEQDAAKDFLQITSPWSAFVNINQGGHMEPLLLHVTGPYMAIWGQAFSTQNQTARALIYGNSSHSLQRAVNIAGRGRPNNLDGKIGMLACGVNQGGTFSVPPEYVKYCPHAYKFGIKVGTHALRLLEKLFYSVIPVLPLLSLLLLLPCCCPCCCCCKRRASK